MKKIRFGIVGYGKIGTRHAEHIHKNPKAELVAVCDIKKERAQEASKKYGCKTFYNFDELLKQDLDVINICTPSGLHAEMSIQALNADKNVVCEKPMTLNLKDAEKVIETEKQSNKKFFLVKQNRYNPPIKALKEVIESNKLGKIISIHANVFWNRTKEYYLQDDWRGTMALDGGALMTQCSHFLDLMLWLNGSVKKVHATMYNLTHPYVETEDLGIINLHFKSGALGVLQYTTNVHNKNMEGSVIVHGTNGTVKVGGEYLNTLDYWNVKDVPKPKIESSNKANDYGTYKGSMSNHDKVIENVIEVLLDNERIKTNSIEGLEGIEVMQAAYISALTNQTIELPLKNSDREFKLNEQSPLSGYKKII